MLPFDLTWLEPVQRRSFRERFDLLKRLVNNALTAFSKSRVVSVTWLAPYKARFFMANGTFVALDFCDGSVQHVSSSVGLMSSASNDSFLWEQMASSFHEASDAILSSDFALLVSGTTSQGNLSTLSQNGSQQADQSDHNLYFVYFGRRHVGSGCEQPSQLDPHVQVLPLSSSNNVTNVVQMTKRERDRKMSTPYIQSVTPGRSDRLRLIMNSSQDLFAVWWTVLSESVLSGELAGGNAEEGVQSSGRSGGVLLFRLNAASCLLSPLAALSPSPGQQFLLLSYSNTAACEMFVIEWCRKEQHQISYVVIAITTYLIDQDELVRLDSTPLSIPDKNRQLIPSLGALSPRDDRFLVAMHNGNLFLVNIRSGVIASSTTRFNTGIATVSWHPTGCLFAVVDFSGKLYLLDLGLSALNLFQLRNEASISSSSMVAPYISLGDFDANSKSLVSLPLLSWNPDDSQNGGPKIDKIDQNADRGAGNRGNNNGTLVIIWAGLRGMGIFRLMLPHPPTSSYLIRHWLSLARSDIGTNKRGKHQLDPALTAAVAIVAALDFDIDGEQAVRCVSSTATALLRQRPMDALIDALLDKCLACFCNPIVAISDVTKLEFGPAISQILRRRALHLLRHGKLETAFDLAANQLPKPATDLLADTFYAALERGELALAKAAYSRARRQVAIASSAVEIPQPTQRRSEDADEEEQIHSF